MNVPNKYATIVFLIDPVHRAVFEIENAHIPSLVSEIVGEDAECYKLDSHDNVLWMSHTNTNPRYAYFWEGMPYPFEVKRYSKALVLCLGSNPWDIDTIKDYVRFYDKKNPWGDV
jgi:hypothetical protein